MIFSRPFSFAIWMPSVRAGGLRVTSVLGGGERSAPSALNKYVGVFWYVVTSRALALVNSPPALAPRGVGRYAKFTLYSVNYVS